MLPNKWFGEDFQRFFTLIAMATRFLHRTQLSEEFERGPLQEDSCKNPVSSF